MLKLSRTRKVSLESGATLLYQHNSTSPTNAFGVWFTNGSRDERECERGLSHLLEHMVFRGTKRRSAIQIALDLESIGGYWDAFTGKESTCYHGKVLGEHFETMADIFADVTLAPSIPIEAFDLERKVIQEEIRSVKDSPEESVHELFFETLFKGHPLGHPVTGYYNDVARYSRRHLLTYHKRTYTASNVLLGFVGTLPLKRVVRILESRFRFTGKGRKRYDPKAEIRSGRVRSIRRSDWSQSHVCIGARTVPASNPDRHALVVLSSILGGGVSSRLFQSLRDRTGLVYSIYSHTSFWRDTGGLWVYFSVDPRNLEPALEILMEQLRDVKEGGIRDEEIESAKAQIKGGVVFGVENVSNRLFRLFQGEFYQKRYVTPSEVIRSIERVSRRKITEVAIRYLDGKNLTFATCGPAVLRRFVTAAFR